MLVQSRNLIGRMVRGEISSLLEIRIPAKTVFEWWGVGVGWWVGGGWVSCLPMVISNCSHSRQD